MADTQDISRSQEVTSLDIIQQKDDVTTCTREIALSTETTGQGDHINSIPTTEAKDLPVTDSQLTQIREKLAELEAVITTLKAASVSTVKSPEHDPEAEEAAELAKRWEKEAEEVRRLEEENIASAIRIKDFDTPKGVSHVASEQWLLKDFRTTWTSSDTKSVLIISMKKFRGATTHVESTTLHDQRPHDDITGVIVQAVQAQNLSEPDILYQEKMSGAEPPARQADRLAFGNAEVLLEIGKKCGLNIPIGSKVLLRPFKPLVYYEEYFRELLRTQESLHDTLTLRFEENLASVPEHKPDNTGENPSGQVVTMTDEIRDGTPNLEKETERDEVLWKLKRDVVAARKLRNGLRCLIYFMDVYMQDILEMHGKIQRGEVKEIAFDYLWMLFKRGEEIVTTKSQIQAYHVLQVTGGRSIVPALSDDTEKKRARISQTRTSALVIDCFYLDFDGKKFGPVMKTFTIEPFEGSMPLSALECIPLPKDGIKRESLIDRGKKFVKATKTAHMNYRGLTVKQNVTSKVEEVDGGIMIDFELAYRNSDELETPIFINENDINRLPDDSLSYQELTEPCSLGGTCCSVNYNIDDSVLSTEPDTDVTNDIAALTPTVSICISKGEIDVERLVLLPYRVLGYALLARKWFAFDLDLVEPIKKLRPNEPDGFADLVLPDGHKDVVRALVYMHTKGVQQQGGSATQERVPGREIDLVRGKGKGLIILLHGAPGVGKTSTAECVAINTQRPLFPITCGDIGGVTAGEVEKKLESFFDLARKWNCVLLLDEADVFLCERTKGDIQQNALVSVFLRVLEYYSGILILTTNRVAEFDEAIKSRIHLSLYYPPLAQEETREVWKMNIRRLERENTRPPPNRPIDFDKKKIMAYSKSHWNDNHRWNGRQIKNAFQTAIALAEWEHLKYESVEEANSPPLLLDEHFRQVALASAHFERYLLQTRRNKTDKMLMKQSEVRDDDYDPRKNIIQDNGSGVKFKLAVSNNPMQRSDQIGSDDESNESNEEKLAQRVKARQMVQAKLTRESAKRADSERKQREERALKKDVIKRERTMKQEEDARLHDATEAIRTTGFSDSESD